MLSPVPAMDSCKGRVHSLESFGSVDGPGVRFVVFLQGCHMRCKYCHNPETWAFSGGEEYSPKELYEKVRKFKGYWGADGGVTVSGGEPLLQIDFLTEFFALLKKDNIHTAIDTAGQPFSDDSEYLKKFDKLLEYTDLVLLDIKHISAEEHKKLTGFANDNILKMAKYLSDKNVPMWIRHVLVPGITDSDDSLLAVREFIDTLKTVEKVEVLPYHALGMAKWEKLGIDYPLKETKSPTPDLVKKAKAILTE